MEIKWKRKAGRFENGVNCYVGKIRVGSVDWNPFTTDKNNRYKVTCYLPHIKQDPNYATEEEGRTALLQLVNIWFAVGVEFLPGVPTNEK
jgi:hypothetical protein